MRLPHPRRWLCAVALTLLFQAPAAHAYLDPSTGSMIISAIVGVFATAALALKTFWYRIKGWFRRAPPPGEPPRPAATERADGAPRPE